MQTGGRAAQDGAGLVVTSGARHACQGAVALGTLHEQGATLAGHDRRCPTPAHQAIKAPPRGSSSVIATLSMAGEPRHLTGNRWLVGVEMSAPSGTTFHLSKKASISGVDGPGPSRTSG